MKILNIQLKIFVLISIQVLFGCRENGSDLDIQRELQLRGWNAHHEIELIPSRNNPTPPSVERRTQSSRSDADEFKMTRELPDITRRLLNSLSTCWLQAGVKELEFDYYHDQGQALPLSAEYMMASSLSQRYVRMIEGEPTRYADLQGGGDMNEVRLLTKAFGIIPERSWRYEEYDWSLLSKVLNPIAGRFRETYKDHLRRQIDPQPVLDQAINKLDETLQSYGFDMPKTFVFKGEITTSKDFGSTYFVEDPWEYVLYIPDVASTQDATQETMGTKQDLFRTSWKSIQSGIRYEIDRGQSVLMSVWWPSNVLVDKDGVLRLKRDHYSAKAPGHVLNITGYKLDENGAIERIKFENTWGDTSGHAGFYTISWRDLTFIFDTISVREGYSLAKRLKLDGQIIKD